MGPDLFSLKKKSRKYQKKRKKKKKLNLILKLKKTKKVQIVVRDRARKDMKTKSMLKKNQRHNHHRNGRPSIFMNILPNNNKTARIDCIQTKASTSARECCE